uniref:response regulator n=1 Tax=Burkholderia pseudomallei TaxID=28450 RepID=UPI00358EAC64
MKRLLVEDNAELAHWIVDLLRGEGCGVDSAPDGESADTVLKAQRYDGLLRDMRLPGMSGKELLARLRSRASNSLPLMPGSRMSRSSPS